MEFHIWSIMYITFDNQLSMIVHRDTREIEVQTMVTLPRIRQLVYDAGMTGMFPLSQRRELLSAIRTLLLKDRHCFDTRCWRITQWLDEDEEYRLHRFRNTVDNVYRWQIRKHDPTVDRFTHLDEIPLSSGGEHFRSRAAALAWAKEMSARAQDCYV